MGTIIGGGELCTNAISVPPDAVGIEIGIEIGMVTGMGGAPIPSTLMFPPPPPPPPAPVAVFGLSSPTPPFRSSIAFFPPLLPRALAAVRERVSRVPPVSETALPWLAGGLVGLWDCDFAWDLVAALPRRVGGEEPTTVEEDLV